MLLRHVTGFSGASGVSQKGQGKPYQIGRLFRLTPIREWKNDHGQNQAAGFHADERGALDIDLGRPQLVNKLLSLQGQYPCDLEIEVEPHPEDPLKNVIVDFEVAKVTPKQG